MIESSSIPAKMASKPSVACGTVEFRFDKIDKRP
jgi:hypothetical protein